MRQKETFLQIMKSMRDFMLSKKAILTVDELAAYTGMSRSYIYKLTSRRQIPFYKNKNGKIVYFKRREIDDWLLAYKVDPLFKK